jgi:hypothetical protein
VSYVTPALGLAVLVLLGVLMLGLNGLAREEGRRPERRPVREPIAPPAPPVREPEQLTIEPLPEPPPLELFDAEEQPPDRSSEDTARRRRTGISPDALEELLDL